jgi:hypothetical protein
MSCEQATPRIWSDVEFEEAFDEVASIRMPISYEGTALRRPPFYDGPMPLVFITLAVVSDVPAPSSSNWVLGFRFDAWEVRYIYDRDVRFWPLASGARAFDPSGRVLAEARLLSEDPDGFWVTVEERHYDSGGTIEYKGTSRYDPSGYKAMESAVMGSKEHEYFLFWPNGSSPW